MRNPRFSPLTRAAFFLLVAAVCFPFGARAAEIDEIAELRAQIRALEQKLLAIEQRQAATAAAVAAAQPPAAAPEKPAATVTAGAGGFALTSADKAYDLKLKALIQFDARFFFDDGAPNRDQFLLRRVRLPFTGTVAGRYDFNITPELAGGTGTATSVGLWDAFAAARFTPAFGLRFGKFPSAAALEPGANRHFIEVPFVNALLPNRDLGVEAFGTLAGGAVDYQLGVVAGVANNTASFGGSSPDLNDGDKTLAGRVTVKPFYRLGDEPLAKMALGLGFSQGNERGVPGANLSNGLANIASPAQQPVLNFGGVLHANGRHTRLNPSLEWYPGTPFSVVAEYARERQGIAVDAAGLTRTFENTAWRVSAGYVLTGEAATKAGVVPRADFNFADGARGAVEFVAGVTGLDLDPALTRPVAAGGAGLSRANNITGALSYGIGLNWYLNRNIRFLINWEQTEFDGAKTPTAATGARDDEQALLTRAHLSF